MIMKCSGCGNENPDNAIFCMYCGRKLKNRRETSIEGLSREELLLLHHELLSLKEDAKDNQKTSLILFVSAIACLLFSDWVASYGKTSIPASLWLLFILLLALSVIEGIVWWKKYREYLSRLEGLKIYSRVKK